jgi:glycosyltransferase involved in cell wall biosynthesis
MIVHGEFPMDVRVASEVRVAVASGFEVDVIALRGDTESSGDAEGARVYRIPLKHRHGAGLLALAAEYTMFTAGAAVRAAVLARRRRYDVVQVHNPPDFLVLAAAGPRLFGARLVFDVHDLSSDMFHMRFGDRPGTRAVEWLLRTMERAAARAAQVVLTVHGPYRDELVERGVDPAKIVVVMNSLDEAVMPPPLAEPPTNGFVVSYHGTITPHYGVPLIVEAAARAVRTVPDVAVRIYGSGDAVDDVVARAGELGIADRVWISPTFLSRREVLKAVQAASVGVIPNLPTKLNRFALSTKLFEYVALGIPVVCSNLPTLRAHFSDDEVLFFEAGNAEALANAIEETARDPARAHRRAEAALRRYREYRWPLSAERYGTALRSLTRGALPRCDRSSSVG